MSAPLVWIGLPAIFAALLFLLRGFRRAAYLTSLVFSAWLWLSALILPIGEVITLAGREIKITETFSILGREFIILNSDRALLILIYFCLMVWVAGSLFARPDRSFLAFAFGFSAVLVAALSVEPFLYAALMIEVGLLLAVPFLSPPGRTPGRGIYRFITFQTIGMPFILLAGWFLAGLEASPGDSELVLLAGILIGIGLAFLLSIVPFHTWIPALAGETEPYQTAFLLFILPAVASIFGLGFLDRFVWLRDSEAVYTGLRLIGTLMVLVGGGWQAVEKHLGRMLGYAAIAETGVGLLAVSLGGSQGLLLFFWLMVARSISFMPWAASVSRLRAAHSASLTMDKLQGAGHRMPLTAAMIVLGQFSLLGLPLLAGFSSRFALWQGLAPLDPWLAALTLGGHLGLMLGGLRTLNTLFIPLETSRNPEEEQQSVRPENLGVWTGFVGLLLIFAAIGFFPQVYLPWIEKLIYLFERLGQG